MQPLLDLLTGCSEEIDLDRAALELARIEYPGLEIEPFIGILDSHAAELATRLSGSPDGSDYVSAANQYIFEELGFKGNTENYYDPRNSCLNEVLTGRTGIPITLAVVYIEIARRLSRPVRGIGMPGHFVVQYRSADFSVYVDVFHGGRLLSEAECLDAARQAGSPVSGVPRCLAPASKRQMITRMLRNLRGVYLHERAFGKALQTINLLLAADPRDAAEYKWRGSIQLRMRNPAAARSDFETYLLLAPEAEDRAEVEKQVRSLRSYPARLN